MIKVRVTDPSQSEFNDETLLTFDDRFSESYEVGLDVLRISAVPGAPLLVSDVEGRGVAINRLPYPSKNTQVPLGFEAEENGANYEISLPLVPDGWVVYLEDRMRVYLVMIQVWFGCMHGSDR